MYTSPSGVRASISDRTDIRRDRPAVRRGPVTRSRRTGTVSSLLIRRSRWTACSLVECSCRDARTSYQQVPQLPGVPAADRQLGAADQDGASAGVHPDLLDVREGYQQGPVDADETGVPPLLFQRGE